jgi:hypothetical protein
MRTTLLLSLFLAGLVTGSAFAADESPISSTSISNDNSPAAVAAAKPWSADKPLVDDATGYLVQVLAGCVVTEPFVAEVEAYNIAVRAFHTKNRNTATPK